MLKFLKCSLCLTGRREGYTRISRRHTPLVVAANHIFSFHIKVTKELDNFVDVRLEWNIL